MGGAREWYTAGSRLTVARQTLTGSDGSKYDAPIGFWDSTKSTVCTIRKDWSDNKPRCLPVTPATIGELYADSSCTLRLASAPNEPTCAAYSYATMPWGGGGDATTCSRTKYNRVFTLGAMWLNYTMYDKSSGYCTPKTIDNDYLYYYVGQEVPITDWVSFN